MFKLVSFAHNWNNGMVGLENQNEYNRIDFFVIVAYFLGQKQKMDV
jgi:hypothetical protein